MRGRPVRDTESVDVTTPPGGDGIGLAEAMAEAARALNAPETLEEVLERLVSAACTAIPGVDYAGVSIARQTGIETKAATDPIVEEADQLQYHLGEGPCLDAMAGSAGGGGPRHAHRAAVATVRPSGSRTRCPVADGDRDLPTGLDHSIDEHAAFGYLTRVSQHSNVRIRDIAQTLVDELAERGHPDQ